MRSSKDRAAARRKGVESILGDFEHYEANRAIINMALGQANEHVRAEIARVENECSPSDAHEIFADLIDEVADACRALLRVADRVESGLDARMAEAPASKPLSISFPGGSQ